jgi:hypothetical protein
VRFDDRLDTVLTGDMESARGRAAIWRQCADLLCQDGHILQPEIAEKLLRIVALLGRDVAPAVKDAYSESAAPYCQFAPLITLLARDSAHAARAFAANGRLDDQSWLLLIPDLGPIGRSALRRRTDLSGPVRAANDLFSTADFALPSPSGRADIAEGGNVPIDIRDLVRRIEEHQSKRNVGPVSQSTAVDAEDSGDSALRFRAGASGRIVDLDGAPRGRFIGLDLSQPARAAEEGCDAATARRFSKRSTISFGRVLLIGDDAWSGMWLCHAEPVFASGDGSFMGYTGTLRRPAPHEVASSAATAPETVGMSADMLRTLLHELRSPLNAISGFAQMIHGQYAGPVSENYRAACRIILDEAAVLSATIGELHLLMHDAASSEAVAQGQIDLVAALSQALDAHAARSPDCSATLGAVPKTEPFVVLGEQATVERLLSLYLHPLAYRMDADGRRSVTLTRTADAMGATIKYELSSAAIAGASDAGSIRPGLGFTHMIVHDLAQKLGGALIVQDHQYILNLPLLATHAQAGSSGA